MQTVVFLDGFTVSVGDTVKFHTKYCSEGTGVVIEIVEPKRGPVRIVLEPTYEGTRGAYDGWPLKEGGDYDRLRTHGIYGGEIVR